MLILWHCFVSCMYLQLGWEGLDVLVSVMLLIVGVIRLAAGSPWDDTIPFLLTHYNNNQQDQQVLDQHDDLTGENVDAYLGSAGTQNGIPDSAVEAQRLLFWAAALPLWARMLMFLAPIHPEFGPLINIVLQMVVEW